MDRVEKRSAGAQGRGSYANEPEIADRDRPLLETPTGRNDDRGLSSRGNAMDADVRNVPIGAQPRSEITGRRGPGSDEETDAGLSPTEEAVRRAAEDTPTGDGVAEGRQSDLPVFEAPLTSPKV